MLFNVLLLCRVGGKIPTLSVKITVIMTTMRMIIIIIKIISPSIYNW